MFGKDFDPGGDQASFRDSFLRTIYNVVPKLAGLEPRDVPSVIFGSASSRCRANGSFCDLADSHPHPRFRHRPSNFRNEHRRGARFGKLTAQNFDPLCAIS